MLRDAERIAELEYIVTGLVDLFDDHMVETMAEDSKRQLDKLVCMRVELGTTL